MILGLIIFIGFTLKRLDYFRLTNSKYFNPTTRVYVQTSVLKLGGGAIHAFREDASAFHVLRAVSEARLHYEMMVYRAKNNGNTHHKLSYGIAPEFELVLVLKV